MNFGFCQCTSVFNCNFFNRAICQVNAYSTHAFCQTEVRLDYSCNAFRNGSHIYSSHNRFAKESVNYAISNVNCYANLRFKSRSTKVRSLYNLGQAKERIVFGEQRFAGVNVDCSASHFAALNSISNSLSIHTTATSAVYETHTIFHFSDGFCVNHFFSFFSQRSVNGDVVRFCQQGIQIYQFNANLTSTFFSDVRVITDSSHFHTLHTFCNAATDATYANDTQGSVLNLDTVKAFTIPSAFLHGLMSLRNVTGHSHEHCHSMFSCSHGVAFRSVQYNNATSSCSRNINIVYANACATDNLQISCSVNQFFGNLNLATAYECVVFTNDFAQFGNRHIGHYVYIKMFTQQSYAFFTYIITYKNFKSHF